MFEIRTTQAQLEPDMIDLGVGQPGLDLLPEEIMREAANLRMSNGDPTLLSYGYEQGDSYFRMALTEFLEEKYGAPMQMESLMTTAGASQSLDLVCTFFTKPGDTVFVEEPTYFLALRIFADYKLNVVGIPTDEQGLKIESLQQALEKMEPVFLYTIPTFQNPAGLTMPAERRAQLLDLSRSHGFFIVADEVYHLLNYGEKPPRPFASFVDSERVFSIGSFSKILAPGLRLGWLQAAPSLLQPVVHSGLLDSGGGLNHFTSNLVRVVLEQGWQETHLNFLKKHYQKRVACMDEALQQHMRDVARWSRPPGGFFFWVELPNSLDTGPLLEVAHEQHIGFQPGVKFSTRRAKTNFLRLSFAYHNEDQIEQGVERLARVVKTALKAGADA